MSILSKELTIAEKPTDPDAPAFPQGPPPWPLPDEEIRQALEDAFRDGSWGRYHAEHVQQFVQQLTQMHEVPYALPVCSGTFAVELALRVLRLRAGDEVVLAGYDFPGNFRAIEFVDARPVLVDIDPQTWSLDANHLEEAVSSSTRAILVSHLHGGLADMRAIRQLADRHGLFVIEDACQSPGAVVQGRHAGTWGDVGVLSFGGSKLLSAGRGGAILTRQEELLQRAKVFCQRGNDAFPLTELQARLLLPQLTKLAERNRLRRASVERLVAACAETRLLQPVALPTDRGAASYYKLAWLLQDHPAAPSRDELIAALQNEGIAIDVGFRGFTRRSSGRCRRVGELRHSQLAAERTILLHHPVLLESEQVVTRLANTLNAVCRRWD